MSSKKLILVITAEQAYIRSTGADETFSAPNDILFSAITDTYIPLVEMLGRLCEEEVPFKINLVLSPVLYRSSTRKTLSGVLKLEKRSWSATPGTKRFCHS